MATDDRVSKNISIGGVVGVQGEMSGGTFTQTVNFGDFAKLGAELSALETALAGAAITDESFRETAGHVHEAKIAAEAADEAGVLSALAKAGRKALDFALKLGEKVAVSLAVEYMKKSIGLP